MHLSHIPQCTIQNRNVHISVLNGTLGCGTGALWDLWIWSIVLMTPTSGVCALIKSVSSAWPYDCHEQFIIVLCWELIWVESLQCYCMRGITSHVMYQAAVWSMDSVTHRPRGDVAAILSELRWLDKSTLPRVMAWCCQSPCIFCDLPRMSMYNDVCYNLMA